MAPYLRKMRRRLGLEFLEPRQLLDGASLIISEFVAANDSGLQDADGDYADWLELHNPTDEAIPLHGWHLSDSAGQPDKWAFPAIELPPGGYEVVFASGKDRRDPAGELHANFRLSRDGEYLGLFDPDGNAASEFRPGYPPQSTDVAYGFPIEDVSFVSDGTLRTFHVPNANDAEIGQAWTLPDYDDSVWNLANGTIGFDTRERIVNAGFEEGGFGHWHASGNATVAKSNYGVEPTEGDFQAVLSNQSNISRFGVESLLGLEKSSLEQIRGPITRATAVRRELTVEAGTEIAFDWNFLTNDEARTDFAFVTLLPEAGIEVLADVQSNLVSSTSRFVRETGTNSFRHTFDQAGTYSLGLGIVQQGTNIGESALVIDNLTVDGSGDAADRYAELVDFDVRRLLTGVNASVWTRHEFDVASPEDITTLQLQLNYDDGFVAFLNGQRVAETNAPAELTYDSAATSARSNSDAVQPQTVLLEDVQERLLAGKNVLAIHALNASASDKDFLFNAQLVGLGRVAREPSFLPEPTPGRPNVSEAFRFVEETQFSHEHGFYFSPFKLTLSTETPGAAIRYTLDGSMPTQSNGMDYTGPLRIESTSVVRAAGFKAGLVPQSRTQTYIFVDDVIQQSQAKALNAGFPRRWGSTVAQYGLDPRVVGPNDIFGGVYSDSFREDLQAIPTLSLVLEPDDIFERPRGIYARPEGRGVTWERPTSVELIFPDGREGFQVDAGLRIQGGISRIFPKLSLRLLFKEEYGPAKLEFPFFGDDAAAEFDSISLRSSTGELVSAGLHYIRDEFMRRSQLATGNPASHGNWVHLYINGLYWGLYNPAERIDAQYASTYFGGSKDEYDVLDAGTLDNQRLTVVAGTIDGWNRLVELVREIGRTRLEGDKTELLLRLEGRNPDGSDNPQLESYLDIDNFIDYVITNLYGHNADWPFRNYYMVRRRGPESDGFKFFVWDAEFTLDSGRIASIHELRVGPTVILPSLLSSEAFVVRFSDRVQKHFSPSGAFYVNPDRPEWNPSHPEDNVPAARYVQLVREIEDAIVAETARWGNQDGRLFTRDEDWLRTVENNLDLYFNRRSRFMLNELSRDRVYRPAPAFVPTAGSVPSGTPVSIETATTNEGIVYYTLDGSDPRMVNGAIAPSAIRFEESVFITDRTTIRARALDGDEWSALDEAVYLVNAQPANENNLRIAEINYNPHDALPRFGELDVDNDQFEFVELVNVTAQTIDLTDVRFVEQFGRGFSFVFGQQTLAPGSHVVVPKNREAFQSRFGSDVLLAKGVGLNQEEWVFEGQLANGGEAMKLVAANGSTIQLIRYSDADEWPNRADGDGSSLEVVDIHGDYTDPANWRQSQQFGGSPGRSGTKTYHQVVINEALASPLGNERDLIEILNAGPESINLGGWFISDSNDDYFKFQIPPSVILPPQAYLVLSDAELGFGLSGTRGEDVWLIQTDASGHPIRFVDHIMFGSTPPGVALGRWPDHNAALLPMNRPTFGESNSGPIPGDSNFDGRTDQFDLVHVAQRGKYLTGMFASYEDGDWNGDGRFDQLDFVVALRAGSFVKDFNRALDDVMEAIE